MRDFIKRWLLKRGAVISRPPGQFAVSDWKFGALKARGLELRSVVDGGAAEGEWAEEFLAVYPSAKVLCVEPRSTAGPQLAALKARHAAVQIAACLLGPSAADVKFNSSGVTSSVLNTAGGNSFGTTDVSPMKTLDGLIAETAFGWPDLIKLDLQGYELEALRGATDCLRNAKALLLEVSFVPFLAGMPLALDVANFASGHGYRLYDIFGLWNRPLDGALAQGDFFFLKDGHPLLSDSRWATAGSF